MTDWKNQIENCFGMTDKAFAVHPSDENAAFSLLTTLRNESVGWAELETETRKFLSDCASEHVDRQVSKMEGAMRFWLLD